MHIINSKKKLIEFGILIGLGFPFLIGWILPLITGHPFRTWTLWIGIPSLILSLIKPELLFYPYKLWMKLGYLLGWLNGKLILGIVFILVLMPISFIMKIFGYDPLRLNRNYLKSYREDKINHKINLTKIF